MSKISKGTKELRKWARSQKVTIEKRMPQAQVGQMFKGKNGEGFSVVTFERLLRGQKPTTIKAVKLIEKVTGGAVKANYWDDDI